MRLLILKHLSREYNDNKFDPLVIAMRSSTLRGFSFPTTIKFAAHRPILPPFYGLSWLARN